MDYRTVANSDKVIYTVLIISILGKFSQHCSIAIAACIECKFKIDL